MNQTKKRLQIINIAISITDIETIQLQMLKLASLRSDPKLQEILSGLQAQNYAQTQALITTYIETPTEEIVQRTSQNDQEVIEEFDLFMTTPEAPVEKKTELFDFDLLTEEKKPLPQDMDFDNLLNLTPEDVMPDNIEIDINHSVKDDFFDTVSEDVPGTKESHIDIDFIPKDNFFDTLRTEETVSTPPLQHTVKKEGALAAKPPLESVHTSEEIPNRQSPLQKETVKKEKQKMDVDIEKASSSKPASSTTPTTDTPPRCKTIPYIDQKLKNMLTQYPPLGKRDTSYESVSNWLLKISNQGYSEQEVEEVIQHIGKLKEKGATAEAACLLLICGATESKYAQFMLARELFRGEILEKNLPEAFTLIHRLAMNDDYPEALCDLAQFYENGIGIERDKRKAEALYKESMKLGVKRAAAHYERLHHAHKGILGKLFGRR